MTRIAPPVIHHADHCGSLLRPRHLREARRDHALGKLGAEALREIEDRAILDALEMQRALGLRIYSDGEFRRKVWNEALEAFDGMTDAGPNFERFPLMRKLDLAGNPELAAVNPVVTGKLRSKGRLTAAESAFLRQHAPGPYKITMPSPAMVTRGWLARPEGRAAYPDFDALIHDVAQLLAMEAKALADEGVPYIQLDAPGYRQFMVAGEMEKMRAQGLDPEHEFDILVEAENLILRSAKRPGNTVAVHICHGTYVFDGRGASGGGPAPYDPARAAELYRRLEADVFLVEYTERGGGPESLRDAPQDKVYCMGVQNVRDPRIETPDEIMRKIEGAAKFVPLANLALCPNCGFSGAAADAWITPDIQKRKLEVLVETAAKLW